MTDYEKLQVDWLYQQVGGDFYPPLSWLILYRIQKYRDEKQGANPSGDQLATIHIDAFKDISRYWEEKTEEDVDRI